MGRCIYARRREIEIMKYVGATNGLVTLPFVVEGLTMGLISGALTALSGGLLAQYQKSCDINVGTGMVTIALASLIIGETLVGKRTMLRRVLGVVFGSCLYRFIVAVALRFNVPAAAMKLVSAIIVAVAISMPAIQAHFAFEKRKHAAQKKEAV